MVVTPSPAEMAWLAYARAVAKPLGVSVDQVLGRTPFLEGFEAALAWVDDEEAAEIAWEMALEGRPLTEDAKVRLRKHVQSERRRTERLNRLAERLDESND